MVSNCLAVLWSVLLFVLCSSADTLTRRSNAEINGLITFSGDEFTVVARYRSVSKTLFVDRADVKTVEVNTRDFNSGEPPHDISIMREHSPVTRDASREKKRASSKGSYADSKSGRAKHSVINSENFNPSTDDVIILRSPKGSVTGRLISIENGQVTVEKGNARKSVPLQDVATILVAPN